MSANWRAETRLLDIPRRPPPSDRAGRPDRGFIEQPEERIEYADKPPLRRRVVIPMADLEREQLQDLADELGESLEPKPSIAAIADSSSETERRRGILSRHSATPFPPALLAPQPETQPSNERLELPETGEAEMPRAKKKTGAAARSPHSDEYKAKAVQAFLADRDKNGRGALDRASKAAKVSAPSFRLWVEKFSGETPVPVPHQPDDVKQDAIRRVLTGPRGETTVVANELGIPLSTVTSWVHMHRKKGLPVPAAKTLIRNGAPSSVSPSSAPMSGPRSTNGASLPPVPTVTLSGLEEYINALVDKRVAEQFRRRLAMMEG